MGNIDQLINDVKQECCTATVILVGNKTDKEIDSQNREKAKEVSEENNLEYIEVSALTGIGIDELFNNLNYSKIIETHEEPSVE